MPEVGDAQPGERQRRRRFRRRRRPPITRCGEHVDGVLADRRRTHLRTGAHPIELDEAGWDRTMQTVAEVDVDE